jgi:hypothetical protein
MRHLSFYKRGATRTRGKVQESEVFFYIMVIISAHGDFLSIWKEQLRAGQGACGVEVCGKASVAIAEYWRQLGQ